MNGEEIFQGLLLNFRWARKYVWPLIHQFTYHCKYDTDEDLKKIKTLFEEIIPTYVIICGICANNFKQKLSKVEQFPPPTKREFQLLLIDIHNQVNESTQKPILSYEDADKLYQNKHEPNLIWYVILGCTYIKDFHLRKHHDDLFKIYFPMFNSNLKLTPIPRTYEDILKLYETNFNVKLTMKDINDLYIYGRQKDLGFGKKKNLKFILVIALIIICLILFILLNIPFHPFK